MPGPPALLLLLLLLLAAGSTGAAPLPQTGAGERARGGHWAAATRAAWEKASGPVWPRRRGIGEPAEAGDPGKRAIREVSAAGAWWWWGGLPLQGRSRGEAMRLGLGRAASRVAATNPSRGRLRYWRWTCCLKVLSLHPFLAVLLVFPDVTCLL